MKANSHAGTTLSSAIVQLKHVARAKRIQAHGDSREKTTSLQEARQLEEAIRLLRWVKK